jgi:hypothetical protein
MKEEDSKKVIMVDGKRSEWYEKAIFIMRSDINIGNKPVDFVSEAEKIINSYMTKKVDTVSTTKSITKKINVYNSKRITVILNICLLLSTILLGITLLKVF